MYILKTSFYDDFVCIADKCPYTCCRDWSILIDEKSYERYKNIDGIAALCEWSEERKSMQTSRHEDGRCKFLNDKGLCNMILEYGEDMLCETCTSYPRCINNYEGVIEEYALQNSCPAVLRKLWDLNSAMYFVDEGECGELNDLVRARNLMIDIMQTGEFPLWFRLFVLYRFAERLEHDIQVEIPEIMKQYESADNLLLMYQKISDIEIDTVKQMQDYVALWQKVNGKAAGYYGFKKYIASQVDFIQTFTIGELKNEWKYFAEELKEKEQFLENICVNYIFSQMLMGVQMYQNTILLNLEYIVIIFTLFLQWLKNEKKLSEEEWIEIVCYCVKITENNRAEVIKYIDSLIADGTINAGWSFQLLYT